MAAAGPHWDGLLPELLADIRGRLAILDRVAFAAVCIAWRAACEPEAPCLVLPGDTEATATIYSITDRQAAAVQALDPAMRDHLVLGSSGGWLVTADDQGTMRIANPLTGEQSRLPAITTIPFVFPYGAGKGACFVLYMDDYTQVRFGGDPPADRNRIRGTFSFTGSDMRWVLYRKVVLSASRRAAMLILQDLDGAFGTPVFATAEDARWRVAPSRDGVEDAVYHDGQFYSITYSGVVEAWRRRAGSGEFTSSVINAAPIRPAKKDEEHQSSRKYLAATLDGKLMVVLRYKSRRGGDMPNHLCERRRLPSTSFFKVQVLVDDEAGEPRWEETPGIGDAALFVGVNGSLCVSTREHPELRAGCVYFTDDDLRKCWLNKEVERDVGVYSLEDDTVEPIVAPGPSWPPPAWFTPSLA